MTCEVHNKEINSQCAELLVKESERKRDREIEGDRDREEKEKSKNIAMSNWQMLMRTIFIDGDIMGQLILSPARFSIIAPNMA